MKELRIKELNDLPKATQLLRSAYSKLCKLGSHCTLEIIRKLHSSYHQEILNKLQYFFKINPIRMRGVLINIE